ARRIPDRRQRGRPHIAGVQHLVEGVEVVLFLGLHLLQLRRDLLAARLSLEHGQLYAIDRDRTELARMVDAQHLVATVGGEGHARSLPGCSGSLAVSPRGRWLAA